MNKKAQEEIAGFVIVVVLVSIIFVIILGFSLNKESTVQEKQSLEIRHFLESIRQVTTECSLTGTIPSNFKELLGACYESSTCSSGTPACTVLEDSLKEILGSSYTIGPEAHIKGYNFTIEFKNSLESKTLLLSENEGNCSSSSYRESEDFFPYSNGQIYTALRLCY